MTYFKKKIGILILLFFIFCKKEEISLRDYGRIENFTLLDQTSKKIEFHSINKPILMFFGYTYCPDYCPITLSKLTKIQQEIPEEKKPIIVFITVDPERDTPDVINQYIQKFNGNIIALTGSKKEIEEITKKLGIYARVEKHGSHIHIEHNTSTFFVDKDHKIRYIFSFKESEENIKKIILSL